MSSAPRPKMKLLNAWKRKNSSFKQRLRFTNTSIKWWYNSSIWAPRQMVSWLRACCSILPSQRMESLIKISIFYHNQSRAPGFTLMRRATTILLSDRSWRGANGWRGSRMWVNLSRLPSSGPSGTGRRSNASFHHFRFMERSQPITWSPTKQTWLTLWMATTARKPPLTWKSSFLNLSLSRHKATWVDLQNSKSWIWCQRQFGLWSQEKTQIEEEVSGSSRELTWSGNSCNRKQENDGLSKSTSTIPSSLVVCSGTRPRCVSLTFGCLASPR